MRVRATLVLAALLSAAIVLVGASAAAASWIDVPENGEPGHLSLQIDRPGRFELTPGDVAHWQIRAQLEDSVAPLTMRLTRDGGLTERPDGLQVQVRSCPAAWLDLDAEPRCPDAEENVIGPLPASHERLGPRGPSAGTAGPVLELGELRRGEDRFLLVSLSIPDTPAARADSTLMGLEATFGIGLTASGAHEHPPAEAGPAFPALPRTGAEPAGLLFGGTVLLAAGAGVHIAARARRVAPGEGRDQ